MGWADLHRALPWLRGQRIHAAPAPREAELRDALAAARFQVHVIEGSRVSDDDSFFREAARALGFPDYFGRNWDALDDGLGDLVFGPARRVAVLWRDADSSLRSDTQTVLDAVLSFEAAATATAGDEEGEPAQLEVFLIGADAAFDRR